jgi:hypothetical protein
MKHAAIVLLTFSALLAPGCAHIDAKLLAEWQSTEDNLMAELSAYIKSDPQKNAPMVAPDVQEKEQAAIEAHLKLVHASAGAVPVDEESAFITKLDEYNKADTARSAGRKKSRSAVYAAHLDEFASIQKASR